MLEFCKGDNMKNLFEPIELSARFIRYIRLGALLTLCASAFPGISSAQSLPDSEFNKVLNDNSSLYDGKRFLLQTGCEFGYEDLTVLSVDVTAHGGPKDETVWDETVRMFAPMRITSVNEVELSGNGKHISWIKKENGATMGSGAGFDYPWGTKLAANYLIERKYEGYIKRVGDADLTPATKAKLVKFLSEAMNNAKQYRDKFNNNWTGIRFGAAAYKTGKLSNKRAWYKADLYVSTICMPRDILQDAPETSADSWDQFRYLLNKLETAERHYQYEQKRIQQERDKARAEAFAKSPVVIASDKELEEVRIGKLDLTAGVEKASQKWTPWLNRDRPSGSGDYDKLDGHLADGNACVAPKDVECRAVDSKKDWSETGQIASCTKENGFVCRNDEQHGAQCLDYEVRFLCSAEVAAGQ